MVGHDGRQARRVATAAQLLEGDFGGYFVSFQAARTKYFDAYFADAVAAGVRQVVVLAAGLEQYAVK